MAARWSVQRGALYAVVGRSAVVAEVHNAGGLVCCELGCGLVVSDGPVLRGMKTPPPHTGDQTRAEGGVQRRALMLVRQMHV